MEVNSENLSLISPASAAQKKLKQTRLPFAILSPVSTEKKASAIPDTKKRKLSGDDGEVALPAAKIGKVQATKKENTAQVSEVIDLVDDSEDDAPSESVELDSSEKIKIKLPISVKKHNKKLKLDQSVETAGDKSEQKHHSTTKKDRSHKKEVKHKKKSKSGGDKDVSMEVICLDDGDDDEPKPLETSIVEELEVKTEEKKSSEIESAIPEGLPKPDIQEINDGLSERALTDKSDEKSETPSKTSETPSEKVVDDLNESLSRPSETSSKPATPGSGLKRSHHKKLSEEEKLKRQQEREEARRLERESKEAIKKQEREAKEQQRLREKQEREAKLQKEREEKETQKRIEREEREKKKLAELEQKAEEKRQKVSF